MDLNEHFDELAEQQQNSQQQQQQQQMYSNGVASLPIAIPAAGGSDGAQHSGGFDGSMSFELPMHHQTAYGTPESSHLQAPPPTPTPTTADIDIDATLLQQFSCLGTTDHEDLITQFQSLMNNQVNKDSAKFFLEMNNWNLQSAVGSYLDYCGFQTLPSMKIVQQSHPNAYQQAWRLQNDGNENWPQGCYLMSTSQTRRIEMPALRPGNTCDILADIPASQPSIMWRMCTPNGWYFGEPIQLIPPQNEQMDLAERMSQLKTSSLETFPQVNVVISAQHSGSMME